MSGSMLLGNYFPLLKPEGTSLRIFYVTYARTMERYRRYRPRSGQASDHVLLRSSNLKSL